MIVSSVVNSRLFRCASVLVAAATGYAPSLLGINAIFGSIGDAIRQIQRLPHGHYTTQPTAPYLGEHPGRDPLTRGGVWKAGQNVTANHGGGRRVVALSMLFNNHVTAVSAAPGTSFPWEGAKPTHLGAVNTANGDVLSRLRLAAWKSRGQNIDFTLYHNSESSYSDELAAGWTWTYDIYINTSASPVVHWGDGLCIPYSGLPPGNEDT